ncbi:hypothetical protein ACQEVC_45520 [Plantactinospora sp. CA-294935]|uniref:hypothetical protein n=1 Tax=Plantactinospora sp. CA-294935 TaxID=3240012 RepID=UPI003D94A047
MPDPLFTLPELDAYTQQTVPPATGALVLALVTTLIRNEVGPTVYDALTDVSMLKPVALDVAKRMLLNPGGMRSRSRQIDDYTETNTYASETLSGIGLTDAEREQIRDALGLGTSGAFTIRPYGAPSWARCC